jgi:CoA:oxalate CoA-transferase
MPLTGITVLDLGRFVAGPFCGALLGDMGADVIKIEQPEGGDVIRQHGVQINGESAYFVGLNRNKKGLTLDLKSDEGKEIFRRMVRKADVLIENFRPDVMRRLSLDYEALRQINPALIYCGLTGFGKDGPYALRPSFDFIAQGMSGLMSVTGFPDGDPVRIGLPIADMVASLYAVNGILTALWARQKTGEGQEVQVSLVDGLVSLMSFQADKYFGRGETPGRAGNDHPTSSPYGTFKASDGYINVAPAGDHMWERFARALGREDLIRDPRFLTNDLRCQYRQEINQIINTIMAARPMREWVDHLNQAGVPCGPIYNLAQVFTDPQIQHQQMVLELEQPSGAVKTLGFPAKLSRTPARLHRSAPQIGEHNDEMLAALGYGVAEVARFRRQGII